MPKKNDLRLAEIDAAIAQHEVEIAILEDQRGRILSEQQNRNISERISSRRKLLGLTLDELSSKAGISKTYLWELENQDKSVSLDIATRLANIFDVSLDWLAGRVSE